MQTTHRPPDEALQQEIRQRYTSAFADSLYQDWWDHSGFANMGYWENGTVKCVDACRALVRRLVEMVPEPARRGKVLDVACGAGGTTLELTRYFHVADITAINIAPDQLDRAARLVPGATFREMDATRLEFPDATFDVVVCVEAAQHFDTRGRFFAEAFRVLKPDGYLVLSDVLFDRPATLSKMLWYRLLTRLFGQFPHDFPAANVVATLDAYVDLLHAVGFDVVAIDDEIEATWWAFRRRFKAYLLGLAKTRPRLWRLLLYRLQALEIWNTSIHAYPLAAVRKPV